jgi:hypothetical protein
MDYNYYYNQFQRLAELMDKNIQKKVSFLRSLLIASSSMLGILVALHPVSLANLCIHRVFLLGVLLLLFGILSIAIALHGYTALSEQKVKNFRDELEIAQYEDREMKNIFGRPKQIVLFCEKCSLPLLLLSLITLFTYMVLASWRS